MTLKRVLFQVGILLLSLCAWLLLRPPVAQTQALCPVSYVVQPGDTLYSIARRNQTTVEHLLALNAGRIANPHRIYIGQRICLPGPAIPSLPTGAVTIESFFAYDATSDEKRWSLVDDAPLQLGRKVTYPLSAVDAIRAFSTTQELLAAVLNTSPAPILLGVPSTPSTYRLVEIGGQASVLTNLTFTDSLPMDTLFPQSYCTSTPLDVLDPTALETTVTLWIETGAGQRYPLAIDDLYFISAPSRIRNCYTTGLTFALMPADAGHYSLWIVLTKDGIGPVGSDRTADCRAWARANTPYYRWLRVLFSCPIR